MLTLSLIPTHKAAVWLVRHIDDLLDSIGLERYPALEQAIYLIIMGLIALLVGLLVRYVVVWAVRKVVYLRDGAVGRQILEQHVVQKCSHFIPPLVFMGLVPFAFDSSSDLMHLLDKAVLIYAIVALAYGIGAVIKFIFNQVNTRRNKRNLPLQGILNVALGILWIVVVIISISILVDKSPGTLLAGLTAFAAALMLIFKDSILGFVAGIQMSENDMLHVGDWIYVPGTVANGNVEDVSLSTVKIRNFDNTVVMVPPYDLVSKGFQNYRPMQESGARRITVNLLITTDSVKMTTPELKASLLSKYEGLKPFFDRAAKTSDGWICNDGNYEENGTTETNIGLYRAYATTYLNHNQHISRDQMIMVSQQPATPDGFVLQIYCFTNTSAWVAYEGIKAAIFEHLTTVLPDFGLELYSSSSYDIDLLNPSPSPSPSSEAK